MDEHNTAKLAARALNEAGFEAFIIGGAVRDLLLDRRPKDFDIATNATPEQIMLTEEFKRASYKDTAQAYGVSRVKINGHVLEVATFRKDVEAHKGRKATKVEYAELEDDLARRDFTINALALDPLTNQVIDYEGGLDDIETKTIRFIGNPLERIREDPLRVLRAVRFKNTLGFNFDPAAKKALAHAVQSGVISVIATDRLRDELTLMLIDRSRRSSLEDLEELGVLDIVLPEFTAGKGIEQPPEFHSEGDVHQLLVMKALPAHPSRQLAWAAFLHDIGKASTQTLPKTMGDRIRFNLHYQVSADMARGILRRLKFSNSDIEAISWMVFHHINIDDLPKMRLSRQKAMMKHQSFADLLKLHRADAMASWRIGEPRVRPRFEEIDNLWKAYLSNPPEKRHPSLKKDLGIDGNWLMREVGLKQTPAIGKILKLLQETYEDTGNKNKSFYLTKAKALSRNIN